ncbi:AlbA family DNA-binding domain-containing protein [Flavitalea sp.]|nr:ATP-binding protein [Flavitalea sp.]
MKSFFDKETFNFSDLEELISVKAEESIYLEFKKSGALQMSDKVKEEISKDISAFANSDGGVIIYGMAEVNHVATEFSFTDGNVITKEWLENVIISGVQRVIPGITIEPVRFSNDVTKTVYVVKIPRSHHAPHMAKTGKYYRRYNFQAVPMAEYEIRDMYGRDFSQSSLQIESIGAGGLELDKDGISFHLRLSVYNEGSRVEKDYKAAIYFENLPDGKLSIPMQRDEINVTRMDPKRIKVSTTYAPIIFPEETLTIMDVPLTFATKNFFEDFATLKVEGRLFIGSKQDISQIDILTFAGKLISDYAEDKEKSTN